MTIYTNIIITQKVLNLETCAFNTIPLISMRILCKKNYEYSIYSFPNITTFTWQKCCGSPCNFTTEQPDCIVCGTSHIYFTLLLQSSNISVWRVLLFHLFMFFRSFWVSKHLLCQPGLWHTTAFQFGPCRIMVLISDGRSENCERL